MNIKDSFELFVEILNRHRAGFVQDSSDLVGTIIFVRIGIAFAGVWCNNHTTTLMARLVQSFIVVENLVAQ